MKLKVGFALPLPSFPSQFPYSVILAVQRKVGVGKGHEDVESFGHGNDGDSVSSAGSETGFEIV